MNTRILVIGSFIVLASAGLSAATMKAVRLEMGRDEANRLSAPVLDTATAPAVAVSITAAFDRKAKFVRRTGGRLPATRGPEYDLDPKVDLASLLTEAFAAEARAMGFRAATAESPGWRVAGTIRDVFLESRQVYMGATLFYGYLELDFTLTPPSGAALPPTRLRAHTYSGGYNAGFGRRDEAESAAAQLLINGAQELLARLNREYFKTAPSTDTASRLARVKAQPAKAAASDVRMLGLSGAPDVAESLLALIPSETDENRRSALIEALALVGGPQAVPLLAGRYAGEDEDCRFYTLKAMDYIGGPDAVALVRGAGVKDEDTGPKRLAERLSAAWPK